MADVPRYDRIGIGYSATRRPDPRIERFIRDALDDSHTVVNVGAGAGSYEPDDRAVVAVEPSLAMASRRPAGAGPVIPRWPDTCPSPSGHSMRPWPSSRFITGLTRRLASGNSGGWPPDRLSSSPSTTECTPGSGSSPTISLDGEPDRNVPPPGARTGAGRWDRDHGTRLPADCMDGFCHAFWARPDAYLDPAVRGRHLRDRPAPSRR